MTEAQSQLGPQDESRRLAGSRQGPEEAAQLRTEKQEAGHVYGPVDGGSVITKVNKHGACLQVSRGRAWTLNSDRPDLKPQLCHSTRCATLTRV